MNAAGELGLRWVRNADEQRTLAGLALDRQMWNAAVALAAAAVERYLKAALIAANTPFPYTHDIERLHRLQPEDLRSALDQALPAVVRARLTDGGTKARYPGGRTYSEAEAREAVSAATSTRAVLAAMRPALASPAP